MTLINSGLGSTIIEHGNDALSRQPRSLAQAERDTHLPQLRATLERVEKAQKTAWLAADPETEEDRRKEAAALRWALGQLGDA